MYQLNFELLEQLEVTCQYIVDSGVQFPNREKMRSLLGKTLALYNEMNSRKPNFLQYSVSR